MNNGHVQYTHMGGLHAKQSCEKFPANSSKFIWVWMNLEFFPSHLEPVIARDRYLTLRQLQFNCCHIFDPLSIPLNKIFSLKLFDIKMYNYQCSPRYKVCPWPYIFRLYSTRQSFVCAEQMSGMLVSCQIRCFRPLRKNSRAKLASVKLNSGANFEI